MPVSRNMDMSEAMVNQATLNEAVVTNITMNKTLANKAPDEETKIDATVLEPMVTEPAATEPAVTEPALPQPAITKPAVTEAAIFEGMVPKANPTGVTVVESAGVEKTAVKTTETKATLAETTETAQTMADVSVDEGDLFRQLAKLQVGTRSGREEDLRTTPLFTLAVKDTVKKAEPESSDKDRRDTDTFEQYAVLGFNAGQHPFIADNEPILLNVDAPSSAFICGSQGGGKSYTLSCILENCLLTDSRVGRVHKALGGVAFHYDPDSSNAVSETAYLCSQGVHVNVLVSRSNEHALRRAYSRIPDAYGNITVTPLLFPSADMSIDRMHRLMAFSDRGNAVPLYMSVALRILRDMAVASKGETFDYKHFKKELLSQRLSREQLPPLKLRLELLESFLDLEVSANNRNAKSIFDIDAGSLTIVDLSDPFIDTATACVLFDVCLSLFKERRPASGLVVVLDEAHKYMNNSGPAQSFTGRLLTTIREQRHNATRVIIATQEPTISEKLLDLCSISIVHRFTSPAWFTVIQRHLGAASKSVNSTTALNELFERIMDLQVGESLLFSPSAYLCLSKEGKISKIGGLAINMRTRTRLGTDGGMSVLASVQVDTPTVDNGSPLALIPTLACETVFTFTKGSLTMPDTCGKVGEQRRSMSPVKNTFSKAHRNSGSGTASKRSSSPVKEKLPKYRTCPSSYDVQKKSAEAVQIETSKFQGLPGSVGESSQPSRVVRRAVGKVKGTSGNGAAPKPSAGTVKVGVSENQGTPDSVEPQQVSDAITVAVGKTKGPSGDGVVPKPVAAAVKLEARADQGNSGSGEPQPASNAVTVALGTIEGTSDSGIAPTNSPRPTEVETSKVHGESDGIIGTVEEQKLSGAAQVGAPNVQGTSNDDGEQKPVLESANAQ